jgi:hypothetical protein
MRRPPWLAHQLSTIAAEFLIVVEEAGPLTLRFLGAEELSFCRGQVPFLAIFGAGQCAGFGYVPKPLTDPDPDSIFARFPRLPLIVADTTLIANGRAYADVMCKEGQS